MDLISKKRVLIIRTSSIGDVVLSTAVLEYLKRTNIVGKIFWVGKRPAISLIEFFFPEVECLGTESSVFRGRSKIDLGNLDLVINLQGNLRSWVICKLLKWNYNCKVLSVPKKRIQRVLMILKAKLVGRRGASIKSKINTSNLVYFTQVEVVSKMFRDLGWISEYGRNDVDLEYGSHPNLDLKPKDSRENSIKWIAIAPGASYKSKQCPSSLWVEFLKNLNVRNEDLGLLVLGDSNDVAIATEIVGKVNWCGPLDFKVGTLDLVRSAHVLSKSICLISNDSALGHIAEAIGVPVAVLFGPTSESFGFAPWRSSSISLSSDIGCRPCSKHGEKSCRYLDFKCFGNIDWKHLETWVLNCLCANASHIGERVKG